MSSRLKWLHLNHGVDDMTFQLSMYYLSFSPLWVSILFIEAMSIVHKADNIGVEILSIIFIPIFFIIALTIVKKNIKVSVVGSTEYVLCKAKEEKLMTAEFLGAYVIPLFAFDFVSWEGMLLFLFFFCVFGYLCIHHNYFCTNIVLDILKYRIYDCELTDMNGISSNIRVISTRNMRLHYTDAICLRKMNNEYSIDCCEDED